MLLELEAHQGILWARRASIRPGLLRILLLFWWFFVFEGGCQDVVELVVSLGEVARLEEPSADRGGTLVCLTLVFWDVRNMVISFFDGRITF